MVSYNPKQWWRFIFSVRKSDTIHQLFPWLVGIGLYCALVVWLEAGFFHLPADSNLKNITVLHTLLSVAISMLLVFRTNTAYDRWWEGRRQWGSLVNSCRNLASKLAALLPEGDEDNRLFFRQILIQFAMELKNHLQSEESRWALDEKPHPEIPNFNRTGHVPAQIAGSVFKRLHSLYKEGVLSSEQLLFLNNEATSLLDICGACERIRNTPIPFSYSTFIKKFIFMYVLTLPIGYAFSLGYAVVPLVLLVFYVLGSLEIIAEEIEEPFGKDSNDLPMQQICETIKRNVEELLQKS